MTKVDYLLECSHLNPTMMNKLVFDCCEAMKKSTNRYRRPTVTSPLSIIIACVLLTQLSNQIVYILFY